MLQGIDFENFLSLERCSIALRHNLLIFVGANGSGKTSILEGIRFLSLLREHPDQALKADGAGFGGLPLLLFSKNEALKLRFTMTHEVPVGFRLQLLSSYFSEPTGAVHPQIESSRFLRTFRHRITIGRNTYEEELVTDGLTSLERVFFRTSGTQREWKVEALAAGILREQIVGGGQPGGLAQVHKVSMPVPPTFFQQVQVPSQSAWTWIVELLNEVGLNFLGGKRVEASRVFSDSSRISIPNPEFKANLENLAEVLEYISKTDPELLQRIQETVRSIVPDVDQIMTRFPEENPSGGLVSIAIKPRMPRKGLFFTSNQISFGTRCIIALVTKLLLEQRGGWLCLEEPEISLHPMAQRKLLAFIEEQARDRRIWITTHSHVIVAEAPIECTYLVTKDRAGISSVEKVTESNESLKRVVTELGINPSHLFGAMAVVFVEGEPDKSVYQIWAKRAGLNAVDFIATSGWSNIQFYAAARICLETRSAIPLFAVLDGDTKGAQHVAQVNKLERLLENHGQKGHMLTIPHSQLEGYFCDSELLGKAYSLNKADVEAFLAGNRALPRKNLTLF